MSLVNQLVFINLKTEMYNMEQLTLNELQSINGGKLATVSDWLILGSSIAFAFCNPPIGIASAIIFAIW